MNTAVLSPQGQVTIPADILRDLGLRGGERVAIDKRKKVVVIKSADNYSVPSPKEAKKAVKAWRRFCKDMEGTAEEAGWTCEQDVVDFCKEVRREIWEKEYANNA